MHLGHLGKPPIKTVEQVRKEETEERLRMQSAQYYKLNKINQQQN